MVSAGLLADCEKIRRNAGVCHGKELEKIRERFYRCPVGHLFDGHSLNLRKFFFSFNQRLTVVLIILINFCEVSLMASPPRCKKKCVKHMKFTSKTQK